MIKTEHAYKVTILLATYNGANYVGEQLDSLLKQTYSNWELLIRDDHSTDGTPQLLADYQSRHPSKIFIAKGPSSTLGSTQNFNALLQAAKEAEFIMFCDQDDFWLPNKIASTLLTMKQLENIHGRDIPLLVYTNFHYVDANLEIIPFKENFSPTKNNSLNLPRCLAQNPVYGCTAMLNRKLADVVATIPDSAENHDYWVALVGSALGKTVYLDQKTLLYRQHGDNLSGNFDDNSFWNRFKRIIIHKKNIQDVKNKIVMTETFENIYYNLLSSKQRAILDDFINFSRTKNLALLFKNLKHGVLKQTPCQSLLLYASLFLLKTKKRFASAPTNVETR